MKPSIFVFAVLLLVPVSAVNSQTASKSPAPQTSSVPVATVRFRSDEAADSKIDGETIGKLGTDDLLSRKLELGDHLIQATSADGKVHWEKVITIENTYNKIISIELTPLRQQKAAPAATPSQPSPPAQPPAQPPPQTPTASVDTTKLKGTWEYDDTQTMTSSGVSCSIVTHFTYYIAGFAPGTNNSKTLQTSSSDIKCSDPADNMSSGARYMGSIEESNPGQFNWTQKVVDCDPPSPCPMGDIGSGTASLTADGILEDSNVRFVKKSDTVPAAILDELGKEPDPAAPKPSSPAGR